MGCLILGVGLVACGFEDQADLPSLSGGDSGDGDLAGDGDGDGDGDSGEMPPEEELEETFRAPVVAGKYLFSANPETDRVARIDAASLEIEVLEGGNAPTYLAALPAGATEGGGALVLNVLSHDASVFLMDGAGQLIAQERVAVQEGASAWAVGKTGKYAVAWSRASDGLLNDGDGYQDLTVLDFRADDVRTFSLSVGFRPSKVVIDDTETFAYVVSEPGISVVDLDSGVLVRELFLPEIAAGTTRDVSFSLDGTRAFVRLEGASEVLIVDTASGSQVTLAFPSVVTDLDLSADGQIGIAVMRGGVPIDVGMGGAGGMGGAPGVAELSESVVATFDVDTVFDSPNSFDLTFTNEVVGSAVVAHDGSSALLFTNATSNTHLTILDVAGGEMRTLDLKAPVRAAFLAEDAAHGVALMNPPANSSKKGAFALVPIANALAPRIQGTDTPPQFVAISAEAGRALITTEATATQKATTFFGRFPGLQVDRIVLPSAPLSSGIVPEAGQGFIAQAHPEGRVTLVDLESGVEKTVTGYELSSRVVQ